jgi:hypothetical protein
MYRGSNIRPAASAVTFPRVSAGLRDESDRRHPRNQQPPKTGEIPMFKRLLLTFILAVTLTSASHAQSSAYRSLAKTYLSTALDYALKTYQSAGGSNSLDAQYAYFYSLYSKYYAEYADDIERFGNKALAKSYAYYSYLFAYYAQQYGLAAYQRSAASTAGNAYLSYLYNYLGYLYSYYAYLTP